MQVRSLGFRTDLMLRRLAGATVDDRGDHIVVRTPANPSFYWGNFLLVAEPLRSGDAERLLDVFSREYPEATHVAIGIDGVDGDPGDVSDLLAAGFELEPNVVLTAQRLRTPDRAATVDVRQLETDSDWQQAVAVRLDVDADEKNAPEPGDFVERRMAELRQLVGAGHGACFGGFVDGRVRATLGVFTDGSGVARYQNVETHPAFRRRGLASALVLAAADHATGPLGASTLVILADPDYVALDLYRGLGFEDRERQVQLLRSPA